MEEYAWVTAAGMRYKQMEAEHNFRWAQLAHLDGPGYTIWDRIEAKKDLERQYFSRSSSHGVLNSTKETVLQSIQSSSISVMAESNRKMAPRIKESNREIQTLSASIIAMLQEENDASESLLKEDLPVADQIICTTERSEEDAVTSERLEPIEHFNGIRSLHWSGAVKFWSGAAGTGLDLILSDYDKPLQLPFQIRTAEIWNGRIHNLHFYVTLTSFVATYRVFDEMPLRIEVSKINCPQQLRDLVIKLWVFNTPVKLAPPEPPDGVAISHGWCHVVAMSASLLGNEQGYSCVKDKTQLNAIVVESNLAGHRNSLMENHFIIGNVPSGWSSRQWQSTKVQRDAQAAFTWLERVSFTGKEFLIASTVVNVTQPAVVGEGNNVAGFLTFKSSSKSDMTDTDSCKVLQNALDKPGGKSVLLELLGKPCWIEKKDNQTFLDHLSHHIILDQLYKNSSLELHADFSYMCGSFVLLEFIKLLDPPPFLEWNVWNKIAIGISHGLTYPFCDITNVLVCLNLHMSLALGWKYFTTLYAYGNGTRGGNTIRVLEFLMLVRCLLSIVKKLTSNIFIDPMPHRSTTTSTSLLVHSKTDGVASLDKVKSVWQGMEKSTILHMGDAQKYVGALWLNAIQLLLAILCACLASHYVILKIIERQNILDVDAVCNMVMIQHDPSVFLLEWKETFNIGSLYEIVEYIGDAFKAQRSWLKVGGSHLMVVIGHFKNGNSSGTDCLYLTKGTLQFKQWDPGSYSLVHGKCSLNLGAYVISEVHNDEEESIKAICLLFGSCNDTLKSILLARFLLYCYEANVKHLLMLVDDFPKDSVQQMLNMVFQDEWWLSTGTLQIALGVAFYEEVLVPSVNQLAQSLWSCLFIPLSYVDQFDKDGDLLALTLFISKGYMFNYSPGGYFGTPKTIFSSQFKQWDPGKFVPTTMNSNLEDKVVFDGEGNVMSQQGAESLVGAKPQKVVESAH